MEISYWLIIIGAFVILMATILGQKLSGRAKLAWWVFFVIFLVLYAYFGIRLESKHTKERNQDKDDMGKLRNQISTLVNSAQTQATSDDMKRLRTEMQTGFDRVVSAITGKQISAAHPEPEKPTPTIENTRLLQKSVPSSDPQLPCGLQVIIQSNLVLQPVAFALECDGEVGKVNFFIAGQTVYMNVLTGVAGANKNVAVVRFSFPPLTPESPLVVTLLSKTQVKVIKASKLNP